METVTGVPGRRPLIDPAEGPLAENERSPFFASSPVHMRRPAFGFAAGCGLEGGGAAVGAGDGGGGAPGTLAAGSFKAGVGFAGTISTGTEGVRSTCGCCRCGGVERATLGGSNLRGAVGVGGPGGGPVLSDLPGRLLSGTVFDSSTCGSAGSSTGTSGGVSAGGAAAIRGLMKYTTESNAERFGYKSRRRISTLSECLVYSALPVRSASTGTLT